MASTIGLTDLFCNTTTSLIGLEIGVLDGHGSKTLLSKLPTLTLHGVDPYAAYKDWDGNIFHGDNTTELIAKEKLAEYGPRFILHKKTSNDAVSDFTNEYFDFIFIDGLHTYEQVLQDCRNYYSKLKPGGVFSGHDYGPQIPDVVRAVDQFAIEAGKTVTPFPTTSWYWIK